MANKGVGNDHDQHHPQRPLVAHEEVHPRPKDYRLARHHASPSDNDKRPVYESIADQRQVLGEKADGIDGDAPRGDNKGPVVEPLPPLERCLDNDDQLDEIIKGDRKQALDGTAGGTVGETASADAQVSRAWHLVVLVLFVDFFFFSEVVVLAVTA